MNTSSIKHKELYEQLTAWWAKQTDFKTKKGLADLLKIHPDTLGDYFSGRKFPRTDIATRLAELADVPCLKCETGAPLEVSPVPVTAAEPAPGTARRGERSVMISLQRADCPFCGHDVTVFRTCPGCGQHFVWANLPVKGDRPS